MVEAIKGRNNIGVVSGISYLHYNHRDVREIGEYLENGFIKGLKFYPGYEPFYPNDNRLKLIYKMAIAYNVPVMFHLLYGTDWSISNMESYLKFMNQLDLEDEKKDLILWKNAAQLFNIDLSGF